MMNAEDAVDNSVVKDYSKEMKILHEYYDGGPGNFRSLLPIGFRERSSRPIGKYVPDNKDYSIHCFKADMYGAPWMYGVSRDRPKESSAATDVSAEDVVAVNFDGLCSDDDDIPDLEDMSCVTCSLYSSSVPLCVVDDDEEATQLDAPICWEAVAGFSAKKTQSPASSAAVEEQERIKNPNKKSRLS